MDLRDWSLLLQIVGTVGFIAAVFFILGWYLGERHGRSAPPPRE